MTTITPKPTETSPPSEMKVDETWHPIPACAVSNNHRFDDSFAIHDLSKLDDNYDDCIDAVLLTMNQYDYVGKEKPKRTRRTSMLSQVTKGKRPFRRKSTRGCIELESAENQVV